MGRGKSGRMNRRMEEIKGLEGDIGKDSRELKGRSKVVKEGRRNGSDRKGEVVVELD